MNRWVRFLLTAKYSHSFLVPKKRAIDVDRVGLECVVPTGPRQAHEIALSRHAQARVIGFDALPPVLSRLWRFVFQPYELKLRAADPLVEFLLVRSLIGIGPPLPPIGKQLG